MLSRNLTFFNLCNCLQYHRGVTRVRGACYVPQKHEKISGLQEGRHEPLMELEASSVVQFMSHSARDDNENVMTEKCREPAFTHYDSKSHFSSAEGLDDQDDRYRVSGSVVSDEFLISCSGGHSTNGDSSRCSSSILISDPSSVPNNDVGTSSSNEHGRNTRIGPSNAQDEGPSLPSPHLISQDTRSSHEKSISEVHFHENPGDRLISHSSHFPGEESYMDSSSHRQPRIWDSSTVSVEVIVIAPKWIEVEIDVHGVILRNLNFQM